LVVLVRVEVDEKEREAKTFQAAAPLMRRMSFHESVVW
jgi:hypothetical protein